MSVTDYTSAVAFLVTRNKPVPRKKIANHTYLVRLDAEHIGVRFHDTDVLVYGSAGTIAFDTGGFLTMSTRERMDTFSPRSIRLTSDKGTWMVGVAVDTGESYLPWDTFSFLPLIDGLTLAKVGLGWLTVPGTGYPPELFHQHQRHNASIRRLLATYLRALPDTTGWDIDDGMDGCALCLPMEERTHPMGTRTWMASVGDLMGDTQHLLEHMHEQVFPPSMVVTAVARAGYRPEYVMGHGDLVRRALRKYLADRLLVGAVGSKNGRQPVLAGTAVAA